VKAALRLVLVSASTVVLHQGSDEPRKVSGAKRWDEFRDVAAQLGAEAVSLERRTRDIGMNMGGLVAAIERQIRGFRADCVLFPQESFRQDHRAVYEAINAALPPRDCPTVKSADNGR
jgi:LmbE family N-acetylglucosaminyl deacetylase